MSNIHCRDALNKSVCDYKIKKQLFSWAESPTVHQPGATPQVCNTPKKALCRSKWFIDCAWRELAQSLMTIRSIPHLFATEPIFPLYATHITKVKKIITSHILPANIYLPTRMFLRNAGIPLNKCIIPVTAIPTPK